MDQVPEYMRDIAEAMTALDSAALNCPPKQRPALLMNAQRAVAAVFSRYPTEQTQENPS